MTLQRRRDPMTLAGAAARVIELVTAQVAADHIERGVSIVYKWANPDDPARPVVDQAMALDNLCAPFGETPFYAYWMFKRAQPVVRGCMLSASRNGVARAAELMKSLHEFVDDGDYSSREKAEINTLIQRLESELHVIRHAPVYSSHTEAAE